MPNGIIVKALSGYYYVLPEGASDKTAMVQCRARGVFKKKNVTPLVGDRVEFEWTDNGEGTVTEVKSRSSELIRPQVANAELAVLVFAVAEPALSLNLLDKFLVHIECAGLDTVLCLTKQDLARPGDRQPVSEQPESAAEQGIVETIRAVYGDGMGYPIVLTSAKEGVGLEEIRRLLEGRISVFSGQSGVGKSSLLNALMPELGLETNAISQKLGRGKHTTRHVELMPLEPSGWVADTPGFSQLDFASIEADELGGCFRDIRKESEGCRFRGCLHDREPGCAVRRAVEEGGIAESRYEHYLQFLTEIRERKRRY
ncbi:putative ribosome biogenesis GTPase RsgA [Paenibacillus sp. J31TS4]|uniref:ribosome small subunit-dependent GTPase A n=1 Tax=Paenibacillus sp. J31TS4 TaxID=2807195 RepID=UPI001B29E9AD|nr:ribosome small subunit-dependent GTPase A [Paenibacillus sp. J31TS4]GIP36739.1 putative ribosome biogenesis GTPase RsgA [Paenibacillus sp. J31TS4]